MAPQPVRTVMIGCGGMARHHLRSMYELRDSTQIVAVCEPSQSAYEATAALFEQAGVTPPPNEPDLEKLLVEYHGRLDAAFIITPHAYHHNQAKACMEAGLDVLLEKPMVINADEALSLIDTRNRTGRLLVVAFPGSLSPNVRTAVALLRSGAFGRLLTISGVVWQNWGPMTVGSWRQQPEVSGGGFLFDTGAHLLNTVVDLAGEDIAEVAAYLDNQGRPVETLGAVIARLRSGALITLHACGEAIPSCHSDVRVFCERAILYTGVWGERLEVQYNGNKPPAAIPVPESRGVWEQFLAVRAGKQENPCPPEVGLRMARLWDAIQESAARGGASVRVGEAVGR